MNCTFVSTSIGCYTDAIGVSVSVVMHYEYGLNAVGKLIVVGVRYTDTEGVVVDTSGGSVVVGPCCCDQPSVPNGEDIANSTVGWTFPAPITEVRTFTVVNSGSTDTIINFTGTLLTLHPGQSRTWGTGDGAGRLDVSAVTIDTGSSSNADVIWEDV